MVEETHQCHFCGEWVRDGLDLEGNRHWLSDCRPDLVEHEPGEICTWFYRGYEIPTERKCYAYQDGYNGSWGDKHIHFYPDGPM